MVTETLRQEYDRRIVEYEKKISDWRRANESNNMRLKEYWRKKSTYGVDARQFDSDSAVLNQKVNDINRRSSEYNARYGNRTLSEAEYAMAESIIIAIESDQKPLARETTRLENEKTRLESWFEQLNSEDDEINKETERLNLQSKLLEKEKQELDDLLKSISSSLDVSIIRQDRTDATFLSTDRISFILEIRDADNADAQADMISWIVHGISQNSGEGNPHEAHNTRNFSFTPNPTNRPTTGSRQPNEPIKYQVEVSVSGTTKTFDLVQDEIDIIRQEYVDFGSNNPPARKEIVAPVNNAFNTGNYNMIVDRGMQQALTNIINQFQTLNPEENSPIVNVSSGYRNPRRNVAAGSQFPITSKHVWGSAFDLVVNPANATMWTRLHQAGQDTGYKSICEHGATQIPCNDPGVDHVHIQW